MRWCAGFLLVVAAPLAEAQPVLEFRADLAFRSEAVAAFAERAYRKNLRALESMQRLDRDAALLERLRMLLARLRVAALEESGDFERVRWEVHTCRDCGESAAAMAGGKLLVGEEFIERLQPTDDELAFLLAHEMAHVLAEHAREFATAARYFMDNGLRREYWDIQRELDESLPVQLRMGFVSHQQELEADYIGCILGARAGFEPTAMLSLVGKLDAGAGLAAPSSSHPGGAQRRMRLREMLPAAQVLRARHLPLP